MGEQQNLHRAELSALERAEQIDEWRMLTAEKKGAQLAPPGGSQPNEAGIKATAKELGIPKREVQRSEKIASISDDAKAAAREAGLDDNHSAPWETGGGASASSHGHASYLSPVWRIWVYLFSDVQDR